MFEVVQRLITVQIYAPTSGAGVVLDDFDVHGAICRDLAVRAREDATGRRRSTCPFQVLQVAMDGFVLRQECGQCV